MAVAFKLKRSSISGRAPDTGSLDYGELAVNTYDGVIYFKKNDGNGDTVTSIKQVTEYNLAINNLPISNSASNNLSGVLRDLDSAINRNKSFEIGADDSTIRTVNPGESVSFLGSGGITTSTDVEGNVTINGPDLSSYVTTTATQSLDLDGNNIIGVDTLRINENGAGLRMTNVGAFDNSDGDFRIFSNGNLILSTNGDSGTAVTFDQNTKDAVFQGDITAGNFNTTGTVTAGNFNTTGTVTMDRLALSSSQTTVPPLQLTANNLNDGVGALRIDGSQADIYLNPTTATHTTITFAVNDDQRLAFGMDNNSDFYITRRTSSTWYDDTFVLDRGTGLLSLGYGATIAGSTQINSLNINGTFTFPTVDGANGQVLVTNGNGTVTWATLSGGGAALTTINSIPDVDTNGATEGDVLVYNGTNWVAQENTAGDPSSEENYAWHLIFN